MPAEVHHGLHDVQATFRAIQLHSSTLHGFESKGAGGEKQIENITVVKIKVLKRNERRSCQLEMSRGGTVKSFQTQA